MTKEHCLFHELRMLPTKGSTRAVLADELFPGSAWYHHGVLRLQAKAPAAQAVNVPTVTSEKTRAIESFTEFAQKKIEEAPEAKIIFPGGEVALQEGAGVGRKITLDKLVEKPSWATPQVKVVFYGETSKLSSNATESDQRANELLDKMIAAMRLESGAVVSLLTSDEGLAFDELISGLYHCKPQFVVSLGAIATNTILGRKEKLTRVHGQFFPIKIQHESESCQVNLMPLFHPDFLLINPNMKRTAWIDLQKIMSELGISIA